MSYISSSVPDPLSPLQPHKMNRQFSGVYPSSGFILSSEHENGQGPLPAGFARKGTSVSSHLPVQRAAHHAVMAFLRRAAC